MPERPLLIFPTPQHATRTKKNQFSSSSLHKPDILEQNNRLSPMFKQLQEAYATRRIEIQQNSPGLDPEQVLVIETIGSIENFANSVKRIKGLEWMGEFENNEIAPDLAFYNEIDPEKNLNGRLYFVLSNQRALSEMLSLWNRYIEDPEMRFSYGLTKFRDVFMNLKTIRRWDVQDRLIETGIIDVWLEDLEYYGNQSVLFETELWYRNSEELRKISSNQIAKLVQSAGGRILKQSVHEGICYHGLLAELPASAIRNIVENQSTELVKCDNVMSFRPVGQIIVGRKPTEGKPEITLLEENSLPSGKPVVALFDGLPLTNHKFLAGRIIVDDPDNWEDEYTSSERIHGSSMASLIIYGDLNQTQKPLSRPIYVRPIMKPIDSLNPPSPEMVPKDCLVIDLIHNAVKRLFDSEQGEDPVAPQIRIINLSIGDSSRQFTHSMSPLARLLDWLSVKYNVLFIVSAGNHIGKISLGLSQEEFSSLDQSGIEKVIIKSLLFDIRNRKLLSPAETINGISVGALHYDESGTTIHGDTIEPFIHLLPSPVSSFGGGYRRSIKPDIVFYGGRQIYRQSYQTAKDMIIEPVCFVRPPGNKTASPGISKGELNATAYSCGTSNSTALISRAASICYDSLQEFFVEQFSDQDLSVYEIPLLKAMLIHGCSWEELSSNICIAMGTNENGLRVRDTISHWIGYGPPKIDRVLECAKQRATVFGFGKLLDGDAHVFTLPLPPSLESLPEFRRLTVTLAWMSPISANTQKYRDSSLWYEIINNTLIPERCDADWRAVRRGTIQHEVFKGQKAEPFIDVDSIKIKVNCVKDANRIHNPIPYGLFVTIEVAEGINIPIYDEIRTRLIQSIKIQDLVKS